MSAPASAFASWIAARSVQTPFPGAVSHTPFPTFASVASAVLLTLKVAACAGPDTIAANIRAAMTGGDFGLRNRRNRLPQMPCRTLLSVSVPVAFNDLP